jgi:hypothetical protein
MNMQQQELDLPDIAVTSLAAHVDKCFSEAVSAKEDVTQRLLKCERQRRGEYDPALKVQIAQSGGQEIFMMLTDIKCRAADAWIKDVMQNHNEATWTVGPTVEPSLPPELMQEVAALVMQEAAMVAAQGQVVEQDAISMRRDQLLTETEQKVKDIAEDKCRRMERRIQDKMQEGGWREAESALIYDFTTYPAVFMKGPILRKKLVMKWGPNFQPIVKEEVVIEVDRVSPYDIFPSRSAVSIQDGFLIQRHRLARKALRQMEDMAGADKEAIKAVLEQYRTGYRTTMNGDSEHDQLSGRQTHFGPDGLIEALEYWGPASGFMLKEWGIISINGQKVDEYDEYQINAWKIGGYVVRVVINPDPLGQRPYSKACFEEIPGAFWGMALPEMMSDVQTICNAAARALASNMGIASGPQVEIQVDRLPKGAQITAMYPWKIWQTTSDRMGGGQPAIKFFQPEMKAAELLQVYTYFSKIADEVTGVPNYVYGSSNVAGAGRTASGLSMLMENAAKGIKHAILSLDAAKSQVITRIYNYLMIHDPDTSIKGDMQIVAAGAIGAMIREQRTQAQKDFLAATANPIDAQIMGLAGRAYALRESAKGVFPDINKVVPDPEKMKQMMEQQAQMQQQAAAQEQAAALQEQQAVPA